jgi:hypothetical protein
MARTKRLSNSNIIRPRGLIYGEYLTLVLDVTKKMVAPHPAQTRHTHPRAFQRKQGRILHHWKEAGAFHRNESGGRSSLSAGHRQRARMIKNRPRQKQERARADLKPRVERTRTGASVLSVGFHPGRPRGGLTNRPVSSPIPTGADPQRRTLQERCSRPKNTLCLWVIRWRNTFVSVV